LESINLITIIGIAFLGSFGHCIGMCGGIVIAYSSKKIDAHQKRFSQAISHIVYSLGRVTTYVSFGVLFGYLGSVFTFSNKAYGILDFLAGILMILAGLSLLGKIGFLNKIEYSISTMKWYQDIFKSLIVSKSLPSFYGLGMLNGLLPCGFVYSFAFIAASTASAFWGGIVMLIFGISTIPALFSLGFFVGLLKNFSFRDIAMRLAAILVIVYGSITIYNGYEFYTQPLKSLQNCH